MKDYFKTVHKEYCFRIVVSAAVMTIVFLTLYYMKVYDRIQGIIPRKMIYVCGVACTIIVFAWVIHSRAADLFKLKIVTSADSIILSTIVALTTSTIVLANEKESESIICVLIVVLMVLMLILVIRIFFFMNDNTQDPSCSDTLIELKDLYEGNIPEKNNQLIQLNETAVEYDLLNREKIAQRIVASIPAGNIKQAYTIGIEGNWGSGKTTILLLAKAILKGSGRNEIVLIDDFEPWAIGNQQVLLNNFYDVLLERAGIRYKGNLSRDINCLIEQFLSDSPYVGSVLKTIKKKYGADDKATGTRKKISDFLQKTGKVFVVMIDDIDRMDTASIRMLLRAIGTILNMPNLVFIIAYEKDRMDEALNNANIEPRYNEKIIQQIITIPSLKRRDIELIYDKCLNSIFDYYKIKEDCRKEIQEIHISKMPFITDIRQMKRYLNSVVLPIIYEYNNLNTRDLLAINTIQFFNQELYESIYKNRKYYISSNMYNDDELGRRDYLDISFNIKKYNDDGKEYFSSIEKQNPDYTELLLLLFPSFKKYKDNRPLKEEGYFEDPEIIISENRKSISSGSYFDLYYTYGTNAYNEVESYIQNLLLEIDSLEDPKAYLDDSIRESVLSMNGNGQRIWLKHLQNHVKENVPQNAAILVQSLLDNINSLDDSLSFGEASARQRAEYIAELLIKKLDIESVQEVLTKYTYSYDLLLTIARIRHSTRKNESSVNTIIIKEMDNLYKALCKGVARGSIDLYSNKYYSHDNIWGLDSEIAGVEISEYVSKIYKNEYVYRVLGDAIGISVGGGYTYWIYHGKFNKLGLSESMVDNSIIAIPPRNETEEAIKHIYELYKNANNEEKLSEDFGDGEKTYTTFEPLELSLLK